MIKYIEKLKLKENIFSILLIVLINYIFIDFFKYQSISFFYIVMSIVLYCFNMLFEDRSLYVFFFILLITLSTIIVLPFFIEIENIRVLNNMIVSSKDIVKFFLHKNILSIAINNLLFFIIVFKISSIFNSKKISYLLVILFSFYNLVFISYDYANILLYRLFIAFYLGYIVYIYIKEFKKENFLYAQLLSKKYIVFISIFLLSISVIFINIQSSYFIGKIGNSIDYNLKNSKEERFVSNTNNRNILSVKEQKELRDLGEIFNELVFKFKLVYVFIFCVFILVMILFLFFIKALSGGGLGKIKLNKRVLFIVLLLVILMIGQIYSYKKIDLIENKIIKKDGNNIEIIDLDKFYNTENSELKERVSPVIKKIRNYNEIISKSIVITVLVLMIFFIVFMITIFKPKFMIKYKRNKKIKEMKDNIKQILDDRLKEVDDSISIDKLYKILRQSFDNPSLEKTPLEYKTNLKKIVNNMGLDNIISEIDIDLLTNIYIVYKYGGKEISPEDKEKVFEIYSKFVIIK